MKITVEKRHFERAYEIREMSPERYEEFTGNSLYGFAASCFCPVALALKEHFEVPENDLESISVGSASYRLPDGEIRSCSDEMRKLIHKVDHLVAESKEGFLSNFEPTTLELDLGA